MYLNWTSLSSDFFMSGMNNRPVSNFTRMCSYSLFYLLLEDALHNNHILRAFIVRIVPDEHLEFDLVVRLV